MKICNKCGVEKELEEFVKGNRYEDGYTPRCKECHRGYYKKIGRRKGTESPLYRNRFDEFGNLKCINCEKFKTIDKFYKDIQVADGYRKTCIECQHCYRKNIYNDQNEKQCSKCKKFKHINFFHKNKQNFDGLAFWCAQCTNGSIKKVNKRTANRKTYAYYKNIVYTYYGYECKCCNETEPKFLTIEHKNGDGKEQRANGIQGVALFRWIINNNFPDSIEILCFNCNISKGIYGQCPHKL